MRPLTAPAPTSVGTSNGHEVTHGAHTRCQDDRPFVTALCGVTLDWDDEVPPTADACVVCRDLSRCPICGAPVVFLA